MLFAVMRTVEADVRARAQDSLTVGAGVVREFLAARAEQLRTSVEVLAADYGLKEATATNDAATIRSVLDNHSRRVGADIAALIDLEGELVASTFDSVTADSAEVRTLLNRTGNQSRESTILLDSQVYHLFSVPLRAPVTIGWVELGFGIDAELTRRLSELTGLDVSISHSSAHDLQIADSEEILRVSTAFIPGDSSVLVVLERSVREAMQPYIEARTGLVAFGAGLLIFVAIAGAWFSTTISRPLQTLGQAARRMISGDYARKVEFQSDDEFGELASSFNAMQTAIAEREERISHSALHDTLTDLPNRSKILTGLTSAIEQARRSGTRVSVLSIRLLRLNEITSTLGYNATDELIKMAARNIQANLNDGETLGHTGSNEFVVILPDHDIENAMAYIDRIEGILGSGVTLGRVNIILQTQTGIAEFPRHASAAGELLRFASIARSEAESGNERVRIYQPGREDDFLRRLRIVNDLPAALHRGDVETWFQPKISLPDGKVSGAEALVRWTHAELGFLNPDDFIPAAEQSGTIVALTRKVIAVAVCECRRWQESGFDLQVSVNLAARDLLDEYLPYYVTQVLKDNDLPAERLTLEITESSIMEDLNHALSVLELLKDIGVRISMDDFGTGHSSLAQLRNIPMHELKIDKSFIRNLCDDRHNESIVRTTIELAHSMGLTVVAEGVEDEPTMRRIAGFGCEHAQGYMISKPMPQTAMTSWLGDFKPVSYPERRGRKRVFVK